MGVKDGAVCVVACRYTQSDQGSPSLFRMPE